MVVALSIAGIVLLTALVAVVVLWQRTLRALRDAEQRVAQRPLPTPPDGPLPTVGSGHRLNPHLFKNTLNTVQSFAYRTNWALERLGRLFDFMLYDGSKPTVSLEEELNFLRDLLELNKLRLGPLFDLRIRIDVDPKDPLYRAHVVPPLITAPLVENAFKHGDLDSDQGHIEIQAHLLNGHFHFSVRNRKQDNEHTAGRKGGLGNNELQQRLNTAFPAMHRLHFDDEGATYKAEMILDLDAALRAAG